MIVVIKIVCCVAHLGGMWYLEVGHRSCPSCNAPDSCQWSGNGTRWFSKLTLTLTQKEKKGVNLRNLIL